MTDERYEFTRVASVVETQAPPSLSFVTDGQRRVHVGGESVAGTLDMQFVRTAAAERKPIFIAFDPGSGKLTFAAPFTEDRVRALQPINGSTDLEVTLARRPAYMRLKGSHPRQIELRRLLERALSDGERVWIGSFPGDEEILDARIGPAR